MKTDYIVLEEADEYPIDKTKFLFAEEVYKIIGACMEVHSILGRGFLEVVYKDALDYEFIQRGIPYQREMRLDVHYKDIILPHHYFADFFVYNAIILEAKAQRGIIEELYKQTLNYLAACQTPLGVLVNFGEDSLKFKRLILSKNYS